MRAVAAELECRFRLRAPGTSLLTDAEMWVPPAVWAEVRRLVGQASTLIHEQALPPRSEGTVHVNLTAAVFQMDEERR